MEKVFVIILASCFMSFGFCTGLFSQNLIPNSGFEQLTDRDCTSPIQNFNSLEFWYLLDATPDLFIRRCPFQEEDFVFWDASLDAFDGENYAGIWSRWNSNDTYFTEGIATSLSQPLEAGKTYTFSMAIKNQGTFQGLDGSLIGCELEPDKHIDIYTARDSIKVINDFSMGTAATSASLVASLDSEPVLADGGDEWTIVSTCFQAEGGETFFALIMPLGTFGELPDCALTMATSGVFRSFYYSIDALELIESVSTVAIDTAICEGEQVDVDLTFVLDNLSDEEAEFNWEDGYVGPLRDIEGGLYSIMTSTVCGDIPIEIRVEEEDCSLEFYVPNVFSPNGDGQNDLFQVHFKDNIIVDNFNLTVLDRWGQIIFESNDVDKVWDGTSRIMQSSAGVYRWVVSFEHLIGTELAAVVRTGDLMLVR